MKASDVKPGDLLYICNTRGRGVWMTTDEWFDNGDVIIALSPAGIGVYACEWHVMTKFGHLTFGDFNVSEYVTDDLSKVLVHEG